MSTAENKALMQRYNDECLNKRDLRVVDELFAPSYVYHPAGSPDVHGPGGLKEHLSSAFAAFPDLHGTIEDMVAEQDKVVVRHRVTATHRAEFMGVAPTGKVVSITGISILRFAGNMVVEEWDVTDLHGLKQQLAPIPATG
jgi:steroid delta-isomerase-like uncharacterized protein